MSRVSSAWRRIALVGPVGADDTNQLLAVARHEASRHTALMLLPTGAAGAAIRSLAPFTAAYETVEDKATAYVCRDFRCDLPTTDSAQLRRLLGGENCF